MSTPRVPLGELCEMDRQGIQPDDPLTAELPFVGVENVVGGTGTLNFDTDSRVGGQKSNTFRFDRRHILYGKLRPYLNKVAVPEFAGRCSTELVPLLPRNGVDRDFLGHLLRRKETIEFVMASVTGSRMPRTDMKVLVSMRVPLPPLDEQRRIAGILNRAARIERLRARTADRLREFALALFIKMFDSGRINRDGWAVATIKELVERKNGAIRTGPFGSQLKHSEFVDDGIPVLGIDNVVDNCFRWTKPRCLPPEKFAKFVRYRVYPEDVLVTIMGTTGRVCVAPENLPECMSTKHLCVLTLNRSLVEPTYVWGALLFDENVRSQTRIFAQGQIMEGWNSKIVKNLCLRIPPLALQRRYAEIVETARAIAAVAESESRVASELSAALMPRLLRAAA